MKTLRWPTLVYSLLIAGILIAPVPSEAAPTLSLVMGDGGSPVPITLTAGICSLSDTTAGYTACYPIPNGSYSDGSHTVSLTNVSLTNTARVLIADNTGAGNSLDLFTLTGVKFLPSSGFTDPRTVRVVLMNTFDAAPNPAGTYLFAMRTGGYFVAGGGGNNLDNFVSLSGSGDFGSGAVPISPALSMQVGSPTTTAVSFSLSQIQQYDSFPCETPASSGFCSPTITLTLTFVVFGPDTLYLTNSADAAGGSCDVVPPPKDQKPPFGLPPGPVNPCKARAGKINSFFNQASNADNRSANQAGADPFVQCVPSEEVDCPCVDPDTCNNGTIKIVENTNFNGTYNFLISGPTTLKQSITTAGGTGMTGNVPVTSGTYTVSQTSVADGAGLISASCTDGEITFDPSGFTVPSGGTVTCTFNNGVIGFNNTNDTLMFSMLWEKPDIEVN